MLGKRVWGLVLVLDGPDAQPEGLLPDVDVGKVLVGVLGVVLFGAGVYLVVFEESPFAGTTGVLRQAAALKPGVLS